MAVASTSASTPTAVFIVSVPRDSDSTQTDARAYVSCRRRRRRRRRSMLSFFFFLFFLKHIYFFIPSGTESVCLFLVTVNERVHAHTLRVAVQVFKVADFFFFFFFLW